MPRIAPQVQFKWPTCLLFFIIGAVLFSGCHRTIRALDPHSFRSEIHLQPFRMTAGNPYAYENKIRGDILLARGQTREAVAAFQAAAAADPSDPWLQVQYGEALLAQNDLERARIHLAKAIQFGPANGRAWTAVARLHHRLGENQSAVAAASFGAQIDRHDTSSLFWLGNYFAAEPGEPSHKKALLYYQRALVRNPTDSELYLAAGKISLRLQHIDLAERYLGKYLERNGKEVDPILNAAEQFAQKGYPRKAIEILQQVQRRNPLSDDIRRQLVTLYLQTHQYPEAVVTVLAFFEEPDTPELIEERINWLLEALAPWEARNLLVEHFSPFPTHPLIRYHLARIEAILLRNEIALALLDFKSEVPEPLAQKAKELKEKLKVQK
jgi:tetratricopeptide (TPR) repeat protein